MKPAEMAWGRYVRLGLGRRLSMLGQRWNIHWLTYNPIHFRHFHDQAMASAPGVMRTFGEVFPNAHRYLDVGAGSGGFAAEAQRLGREVVACEHSKSGRRMANKQGVDCRPFDLNHDPPADVGQGFDLAYCFEVAEHLPPELGRKLVDFLSRCAPLVAFSAAQPGQGGTGHINEQPRQYWIDQFATVGMAYSSELSEQVRLGFQRQTVAQYLANNIIVLTASEAARGTLA